MEKALEAWKIAPKAGGQTKRPDTQAEISTLARQLTLPFGPTFVSEMTAEKVASFLETIGRGNEDGELSPRAFNKRITLVSGFFSYCEKHGWTDGLIIKRLKAKRKKVEEKESKQPGILTPAKFALLLEKAGKDPSPEKRRDKIQKIHDLSASMVVSIMASANVSPTPLMQPSPKPALSGMSQITAAPTNTSTHSSPSKP